MYSGSTSEGVQGNWKQIAILYCMMKQPYATKLENRDW